MAKNSIHNRVEMRAEISIQNLKSKFIDKVEELSEENIYTCYQCGNRRNSFS